MEKSSQIRGKLEKRLGELSRRADRVEADLRRGHSRDSQDRASERENDEVLEGLDREGLRELEQIRAALGRLDAGSYGRCARCGEAIAENRLAVLPYAIECIDCAV